MPMSILKFKPTDIHHLSQLGTLAKNNQIEKYLTMDEQKPFDPAKDYYGGLRKTLCKCLRSGRLSDLIDEVQKL